MSSENAAAPFEDTLFAPQSINILVAAARGMIRRTIYKETGAFFTKKKTPGFCVACPEQDGYLNLLIAHRLLQSNDLFWSGCPDRICNPIHFLHMLEQPLLN